MSAKPPIPPCRRCQQRIVGPYVQALEACWHPACWRCEGCGLPLPASFVPRGGFGYHPDCYEQRFGLRCSVCQEVIKGQYFQHEGRPVCARDYQARLAARCVVCNQALTGAFVRNGFGQTVCERHRDALKCASCDRWLNEVERAQGLFAVFGTPLCGPCQASRIEPPALAGYGNAFGMAALARLGLRLASPTVPLRLDSVTQIRMLQSPIEAQAEGLTRTQVETLQGTETARAVTEIVVVGGLAKDHFEGVLAHEFGHVWLFHERYDHAQGLLAEGFCELVKHLWLEGLGTPLARELQDKQTANPNPIYGDGFRRFKGRWDQDGLAGVLELLRA